MRAKARPAPVLRALRTAPGSFCEKRREPTKLPWACWRAASRRRSAFPGGISDIVRRRRDVSSGPAIRLGRYFGVDPRFWLNLQAAHDLSRAESEKDYSRVRSGADARPELSRADKIWRP